ncbi:TRAP transporter small permease [Mangrovicoccus sp. HB161399]|uniref:TRAP transporter small permease n=1 Tax=Mangrovicoccus sp. HB161399 TaxID=2720392 RepID=UPI0015517A1E|nr:TRAP transporter small permease subunit [Mangrovicoccus sp. HB161399]
MTRAFLSALRGLSALLLAALILVTVTDVVGRYILNAPLPGAFELTQILLALLVFAALPLTTARREHVEVDLMAHVLTPRLIRAFGIFAALVTAAALAFFAVRLGIVAGDQAATGARSAALGLPMAAIAGVGVASCAVSAAIALAGARNP